jgi:uncharacterized phage-associated protein
MIVRLKSEGVTARAVAAFFIWLCNQSGGFISNLKLQKVLYYAQGWHMALKGKPLFSMKFKAWVHGPVLPEIWHDYKKFSYKPIIMDVAKPDLPPETEKFLRDIASIFFPLDAYELELATHRELPWLRARRGLAPDAQSNTSINDADMLLHFSSLAKSNEQNKASK